MEIAMQSYDMKGKSKGDRDFHSLVEERKVREKTSL